MILGLAAVSALPHAVQASPGKRLEENAERLVGGQAGIPGNRRSVLRQSRILRHGRIRGRVLRKAPENLQRSTEPLRDGQLKFSQN